MSEACRSCGAPIFWKKHIATQRPNPMNVQPDPTGNVRLEGTDHYAIVPEKERGPLLGAGVLLYKSHYATCPNAKTWRTGRKR